MHQFITIFWVFLVVDVGNCAVKSVEIEVLNDSEVDLNEFLKLPCLAVFKDFLQYCKFTFAVVQLAEDNIVEIPCIRDGLLVKDGEIVKEMFFVEMVGLLQ